MMQNRSLASDQEISTSLLTARWCIKVKKESYWRVHKVRSVHKMDSLINFALKNMKELFAIYVLTKRQQTLSKMLKRIPKPPHSNGLS